MATIIIKNEGQEPEVLEDVYTYVVLTVPKDNPDNGSLYTTITEPTALAKVGAWFISLAKSISKKEPVKPLDQVFGDKEKRLFNKRDSGIYLPN